MLSKLKDMLLESLGWLGAGIFIFIILAFWGMPFTMIGTSWWLSIILMAVQYLFRPSSLFFWCWGLVCAIKGPQEILTIVYYVMFAIYCLPDIIKVILAILESIFNPK